MPEKKPTTDAEKWAALTQPFAAADIEKLPKPMKSRDEDRGSCQQGSRYSADGYYCGKYHARAIHLDYVGHAGITMRLNDVLGPDGWDFYPYALTPEGLPFISQSVFYARLSIMGVDKWDMAANFNGPQEAYGDALRRCAMRFGIGTYLWSRSETAAALADGTANTGPATPNEELLQELNALPTAVADTVRANWPAGLGMSPMSLSADGIAAVREVVKIARQANLA